MDYFNLICSCLTLFFSCVTIYYVVKIVLLHRKTKTTEVNPRGYFKSPGHFVHYSAPVDATKPSEERIADIYCLDDDLPASQKEIFRKIVIAIVKTIPEEKRKNRELLRETDKTICLIGRTLIESEKSRS